MTAPDAVVLLTDQDPRLCRRRPPPPEVAFPTVRRSGRLPVHTTVFLLRSALGPGGGLVCAWELTRQASGPGRRKPRLLSAVAALTLAGLLAV